MWDWLITLDWNTILTYGLKVLGYAIGTIIITLSSILFTKLKEKIGEGRLNFFIEKCVQAAEQLYPNLGQKTGKQKYEYVLGEVLKKYPKLAGNEHLKTLIEAAVYKVSEEVKQIAKTKEEEKVATINSLTVM